MFFIDFKGHVDNERVKLALADVAERVSDLKILGSYPKGVL